MKIIKKQDVSNWSYQHTCTDCDTVLEVDGKDLILQHHQGDYRNSSYDSYSANCAVCKHSFTVPINDIPKLIQVEVKARTVSRSYR